MEFFKGLRERIGNFIQKRIDDAENKIIHNKNINSNKLYQGIISSEKNGIQIFDLFGNFFGFFTNDFNKFDIQRISNGKEYQFNLTGKYVPYEQLEKLNATEYYYLTFKNDNKSLICMKLKDVNYDEMKGFTMKCEILVPFNEEINIKKGE